WPLNTGRVSRNAINRSSDHTIDAGAAPVSILQNAQSAIAPAYRATWAGGADIATVATPATSANDECQGRVIALTSADIHTGPNATWPERCTWLASNTGRPHLGKGLVSASSLEGRHEFVNTDDHRPSHVRLRLRLLFQISGPSRLSTTRRPHHTRP